MEQGALNTIQQQTDGVIGSGARLTIDTIADYIDRLRTGLAGAETLILEFNPKVEMDLTALQALCSACKTAAASGKRCHARGPLPKALVELVVAAGAGRHQPCGADMGFCFRQLGA